MSFTFKQFHITDSRTAMKVGTDAVVLGAWIDPAGASRILDIGSGCGILALMMAQRVPGATVEAVEIDAEAAADAAANFSESPWTDRIRLTNGDIFDFHAEPFDLIMCNPPFFTETLHAPDPSRSTARHEGRLGVASLLKEAKRLLAPRGSVAFVAPALRDSEIDMLLAIEGFCCGRILEMRQRADRAPRRTFRQMWLSCGPIVREQIILTSPQGERTDQYSSLTSDFYL